jgi:hypothetical protein
MQRLRFSSVPILLVLAACAHKDVRSPDTSGESAGRPAVYPPTESSPGPAELPKTAPVAPAPESITDASPSQGAPPPAASPGSAPEPKEARPPSGRSGATVAKTPASGTSTPPPAAVVPNAVTAPSVASQTTPAAAPALDLKTLEQRLRDTRAIGVFTKLSLKNQVDDLLAQFKTFYGGHSQLTLVQLRQKYEVLLLKVVSVLQNDDPQLASAVSSSREAIWSVLADPKSFANI